MGKKVVVYIVRMGGLVSKQGKGEVMMEGRWVMVRGEEYKFDEEMD